VGTTQSYLSPLGTERIVTETAMMGNRQTENTQQTLSRSIGKHTDHNIQNLHNLFQTVFYVSKKRLFANALFWILISVKEKYL
jgi:hypothetical protein